MGDRGYGRGLTRRRFLQASGGALAGAYLLGVAGCGGESGGSSGRIQIPDAKTNLPEGDVTFRLIDSGDRKALFWDEFFPAYQEKHSNIACEYDGLPWEELNEVVPLGIRNGSAHDVFAMPQTVPGPQAVSQGWVAPLDDIIPNFDEWKASFPEGSFFEGVHEFDGKTYTFPLSTNQRYSNMLLYSSKYMEEAGYDPASKPLTWDEYRDAARKITKKGDGNYYGVIFALGQPAIMELIVTSLAHEAGALSTGGSATGYMNLKTGEYSYTSDEIIAAIELIMALKQDGSVFPGSASLLAPETWVRVPQGAVGMLLGGPWIIPEWQEESPDFEFGVAAQPAPNSGDSVPLWYSPANLTNSVWFYAKSKLGAVAGDVLSYVSSIEGQKAWASITGGIGDPPVFPEARQAASDNPQGQKAFDLADTLVLAPDPIVRNPDVGKAFMELKPATPTFGEIIQGIFIGDITDIPKAMQDLKDRSEQALDDAIAAARQEGADVSRDDWVFSNWDPTQDYAMEKYDES